jgi:hypothetical protein
MVNKVCTLISRCEEKDLIDLYFLSKRGFEVAHYFEEAARKEGGLEPAMISYLLSEVEIKEAPPYLLQPVDLEDLNSYIRKLQKEMGLRALPE